MRNIAELLKRMLKIFKKGGEQRGMAQQEFKGSTTYWEERYASGSNSGVGSYGRFAEFKASVLNNFVATHGISDVIEFGCGDGNQLLLSNYPNYLGIDVSKSAIEGCRNRFPNDDTRRFLLREEYLGQKAELAISLDVIYHLVEDPVFEEYMAALLDAATCFAIIYSSNTDEQESNQAPHVRHRRFTDWIETHRPQWRLIQHIPNQYPYTGDYRTGSFADFFVFEKTG